MEYSTGCLVYKKGDNIMMTVEKADGNDIHCVWFNEQTLHRKIFNADELEIENFEKIKAQK